MPNYVCMGMLISKIAIFVAQKTQTWSYRSQWTYYVWVFDAAYKAEYIICSYSSENGDGTSITINGDTYRTMISERFVTALHGINKNDVWFQKDGAICHTPHAKIDLLR